MAAKAGGDPARMGPARMWEEARRHLDAGRKRAALPLLERLAAIAPREPAIAFNLGCCQYELGRFDEAARSLDLAVKLAPQWQDAWFRLARACHAAGRLDAAGRAYAEALRLSPDLDAAALGLAQCLMAAERPREAADVLRPRLERGGDAVAMLHAAASLGCGRVAEAEAAFARVPAAEAEEAAAMTLLYRDDVTPGEVAAAHRSWAARHLGAVRPLRVPDRPRDPAKRLRIGYVSPDFCHHAVAKFILPVIEAHDRAEVEVFCYASVARPDDVTALLSRKADRWRDIAGLDDDAAARRIAEDRVDILIDLAGHSQGNRLGVFARRPAPVQASWLGYPATTGLERIDYLLCDATVAPPDEDDSGLRTEAPLRLEGGFHRYTPLGHADIPAARPEHPFTFGSFNTLAKLSDTTVALWAAVLNAVPDSLLMLKRKALADAALQGELAARFAAHGIAPGRLLFRHAIASTNDHLGQYGEIDAALDCHPYNGTTTTCDALYMGVPVVALLGDRHCARMSASLLREAGLPQLVAADAGQFVAIAAELAAAPGRLAPTGLALRHHLLASPLGGGDGVTRALERALRVAWAEWAGK